MVRVTNGPGRPGTAYGRATARHARGDACSSVGERSGAGAWPSGTLAAWTLAVCLGGGAALAGGHSGTDGTRPPPGWTSAFDDGRLNPQRGRGTAGGDIATSRLWTDSVPRRARPGADIAHGAETGPPPGYAYAFGDGRLNPRRGLGAAF